MTSTARPRAGPLDWVEFALGACVVGLAGLMFWGVYADGYLAQPFFYDTNDTLMDFYNTAYWAHADGPYTVWQSIYPPISFAILQVITPVQCYTGDSFQGRECDRLGWLILVGGALALGWLVALRSTDTSRLAVVARVAAVLVGLPTVFCLERGNLLLLAAPALLYGLTRPVVDVRSCLALAVAINLKPYLLLIALPVLVVHGGRALGRLLLACSLVYVLSILLVGDGLPWDILTNVRGFTGDGLINHWEKFYYATSFGPFVRVLESELPVDAYLDSRSIVQLIMAMRSVMLLCSAALPLALLAAWLLPREQRPYIPLTCAVLTFGLVLTESFGGYATMLSISLLFTLPGRGRFIAVALVICYLLSLPYDYLIAVVRESESSIWLTGREVETRYGVAIGQALRPALIALAQLLLCASIIAGTVRAFRAGRATPDPHESPAIRLGSATP
jgi:hypothetical protein